MIQCDVGIRVPADVEVTIADRLPPAQSHRSDSLSKHNARAGARTGPSISNESSGFSACGVMKRELCTMAAKDRSAVVDDRAGAGV